MTPTSSATSLKRWRRSSTGFAGSGLNWDEGAEVGGPHGPYYQSEKRSRYREACTTSVDSGHAYWDFATEDEMMRARGLQSSKETISVQPKLDGGRTEAERGRFEAQGPHFGRAAENAARGQMRV
jgi:glutamyl-tRNA synthetase